MGIDEISRVIGSFDAKLEESLQQRRHIFELLKELRENQVKIQTELLDHRAEFSEHNALETALNTKMNERIDRVEAEFGAVKKYGISGILALIAGGGVFGSGITHVAKSLFNSQH